MKVWRIGFIEYNLPGEDLLMDKQKACNRAGNIRLDHIQLLVSNDL